ncbi:MAG: hypothetical protein HGA19_19350, partial [Oscillochloris sp.]|nr:hypothetical protein [Oscillochloris sp.]
MNTTPVGMPSLLPLIVILLGSSALALTNAFRAVRHRMANVIPFSLLMLATAWWSFGYAMELSSHNLPSMLLWAKTEYLSIVSIPLLWLSFTVRYSHDDRPVRWRCWLPLMIIPLITLGLVATNEWHGLIWASSRVHRVSDLHILQHTYGPWFWVYVVYAYMIVIGGSVALVREIW